MAHVLAEDAKLYYNTGTYASPTWTEICNVKDLTLSLEKDEIDVTTRCSGGFKEYADGLLDANVTFNMLYDPADAAFTALQSAFFAKTAIEFAVMDGVLPPASGNTSQGLRATCMIKSFSRSESLGEALMTDVAIRPVVNDDAAPAWMTETTP
jgi:predicted secreted protein